MRHIFISFYIFLFIYPVFGQNDAVISGRIFDDSTKTPLPYATITLNQKSDGKMVAGSVADKDGRFSMTGIAEGEYIVNCTFIGYNDKQIPLLAGKLNKIFNLGRINLTPISNQLDEVVVTAKKEIVSAALDKKTFNIENNVTQSGGSVLDAMRNLPGVSVDQDGNILLRGSDKVTVLIDGKQSSLTGYGNQKGLDNIPASNIEKIEIINNPSAKYDSKGMAGIVNIIYKKEKETGFRGDVSFNYGLGELTNRVNNLPGIMSKYSLTPKYNPAINLNYRTKKINVFVQGDGIVRKRVNTNEFITRTYTDGTPDIKSQFLENRTQQLYNIKGGFDWYINDNNTLTLFSLFQDEYHIDRGDVPYDYMANGQRKRLWTWAEDENTRFINYAANYKHKFSEPGHEIELNYIYTKGGEDERFPFTDSSSTRNSVDETHLIVNEIISDINLGYVKPLRSGRVELGSKALLRKIPITYTIKPGVNSILNPNLGQWSEYNENIYSMYGNYVYESRKLDIEGGLRLEESTIKYEIDPLNIYYTRNDAYNYLSLFPNVRFTYKFNSNKISAFYNRRVDRPGEFDLRPFPKYDDPEILKTGNPYLRPQFTQTYEAAYKRSWKKGSAYLAGYYRLIEDIFSRIYTTDTTAATTVINTITQNLGHGTNLGFEASLEQSVTEKINLNGSFNWYQNTINAFSGTSIYPYPQHFEFAASKAYTWNCKLNMQIKLPSKMDGYVSAIYYAPDIIPQGKIKERYSVNLGLKKRLYREKVELTLTVTDLFNTFGIRKVITGNGFELTSENYYETQVVIAGLKYKF